MNILLIISDTVRHDYCGCYGSPWVRTPHIDALAREGTVMERFYTASFPTGPMRKDVHSGRFTFTYTNWSAERSRGEPVLAELLSDAGYLTAHVGDTSNSAQLRQGFQHEQIVPSEASRLREVPEQVPLPADPRKLRIPMDRIRSVVRNARGWDGEADRRVARSVRAAHRWLEERAADRRAFFLWFDTFDPHEPWDPPRYYIDLYDPGYRGDELMEPAYEPAGYASEREIQHMRCMYAAKLTMVDRWIGHLLDGLRLMGLAEETAVVFTSDHGFYHGEHGLIGKVQLDREGTICGRWPLYETIAHPPLIVRGPGLPKSERRHGFCQPPDLAPTILELAGVEVPSWMHGRSLLPMLAGEEAAAREAAVSSCTYVTDAEVRCPTSFRTDEHLYVYGGDEWESELYDLRLDPAESENVIGDRAQTARLLHERMLEFLRGVECPHESLEARREFLPKPRNGLPRRRLI
jgi:arylsulfatase A-like enzyme